MIRHPVHIIPKISNGEYFLLPTFITEWHTVNEDVKLKTNTYEMENIRGKITLASRLHYLPGSLLNWPVQFIK